LRRLGGPIAQTIEWVSDLFAESQMSLTPLTQIFITVAGPLGACHFTDADIPAAAPPGISRLQDVDRGRPAPVRSTSTVTASARKQPAGRRAVQAEHQGQEAIPACLSPG
jgi:hypothetical protein